jgi:fucose permease
MSLVLLAIAVLIGVFVPMKVLLVVGVVIAVLMAVVFTFKSADDLTPLGELGAGLTLMTCIGCFVIAAGQYVVGLFT